MENSSETSVCTPAFSPEVTEVTLPEVTVPEVTEVTVPEVTVPEVTEVTVPEVTEVTEVYKTLGLILFSYVIFETCVYAYDCMYYLLTNL